MEKPVITKECVKPLLETPFLNVADLQYAEGRHGQDSNIVTITAPAKQ